MDRLTFFNKFLDVTLLNPLEKGGKFDSVADRAELGILSTDIQWSHSPPVAAANLLAQSLQPPNPHSPES